MNRNITYEDITSTCAEWLKNKLRETTGEHTFGIFTYKGEYGWEDNLSIVELAELVKTHESLIIYNRELDTFTKYDFIGF